MAKFNDRFKARPLSYSQLSSFEYNKEDWYRRYIKGKKDPPNAAMMFGSLVGDSIGTDTSMVPLLIPPGVKEYELHAQMGDISIIGYADHFCPDTFELHENKTSNKLDRWDQRKTDEHPQLTMYALMLFLRDKIKPEHIDMQLNFIPVIAGGATMDKYRMPDPVVVHSFKTKRTTRDVLEYASYVVATVKLMEEYIQAHD